MVTVTVCIGSSCHIKGSRRIVETLQQLISETDKTSEIELGGTPCIGKCKEGVCVSVNGELFSVTPETTEDFFKRKILPIA